MPGKETFEDEIFRDVDHGDGTLPLGSYDGCSFVNCNLSRASLARCVFLDCVFERCNLSMAVVTNASFRDVEFVGCKLVGLRFDECNGSILSFGFTDCQMSLTSFYGMRLQGLTFRDCTLDEADFSQADLTAAVFECCDLRGATFGRTILERADLSGARGYCIDPETNRVRGAKFSVPAVVGLLDKYGIEIV